MQLGIEPSRRDFANLTAVAGEVIVIENGKELDEREYEKGVYFEFFQKLTLIEN